ncbi:hypothetical protein [Marinobacterium arenosum]|uniref:hypothetical protein n=1 Tax=Marinobacterium arenosum TaxID=2862496 RepID=UPI001C97D320|nr:hypothetical protein [Marinobacterium arenosum]MBY4676949.1 hypothetical protein [Marinobacterium arenosum]
MLTYQECLDLCGLSDEEVAAIAEHEHLDPMVAMALGNYLLHHDGEQKIRKIILDDIAKAKRCGNHQHEQVLRQVLAHFIATHPERKARQKE